MIKPIFGFLITAVLALGLVACNAGTAGNNGSQGASEPAAGGAGTAPAAPAGNGAGAANTAGNAAAGSASGLTPASETSAQSMTLGSRGAISDTTAIPPSAPRAEDEGDRRIAQPAEAMKAVPFKMLGINSLPADGNMDVLFVITPRNGETKPNLPAIRMIYTWSPNGAVVLYQSPATGQFPPGGEALTVNGHEAQFYTGQMSTEILEWEQDGVHVQLRGTGMVDKAVLLEAAKSVGPYQEPTR